MASSFSQGLIGLDTNIISYALDPAFEEHKKASSILKRLSPRFKVAINPTVLHESYHTLVYKQKWFRPEASNRLLLLIRQKHVLFLNQTKSISRNGLYLADKYELGGRDALILANYLLNGVNDKYTNDNRILQLGKIALRNRELRFSDPLD